MFWSRSENTSCGNTCHKFSYARDDDHQSKSHPQQKKHTPHNTTNAIRIRILTFLERRPFHISNQLYDIVDTLADGFHANGCLRTKSKIPRRTLTTTTSEATTVHILKNTAILLIVIHLSLSTTLITTLQPLLPSILVLPSQKAHTAFLFSVLFWC